MVLRQALPECGRFLNNVLVIAALWPRQGGFEGATIPNTEGTSEPRDQLGVDDDHLVKPLGTRSLSQMAEQFRVLIDELFDGREKRRW